MTLCQSSHVRCSGGILLRKMSQYELGLKAKLMRELEVSPELTSSRQLLRLPDRRPRGNPSTSGCKEDRKSCSTVATLVHLHWINSRSHRLKSCIIYDFYLNSFSPQQPCVSRHTDGKHMLLHGAFTYSKSQQIPHFHRALRTS